MSSEQRSAISSEVGTASGHSENVYFEVQENGIAEQAKANQGIERIAREVARPLVGTCDVHYLRREDYANHGALLCVQTKSTIAEPKLSFDTNEFFLKDSDEMASSCYRPSRPRTGRSRWTCCDGLRARA
jgi:DNA polymerase III alpha subunit